MLTNHVLGILFPTQDQVFVEIGIESDQPIEAIIVKTQNVKGTLNDMAHLKKFVKKLNCEALEKVGLTLLGEHDDTVKNVFPPQIIELLAKHSNSIHMVHLTDQQCYSPYPLVLKFTISIGETADSLDEGAKVFSFLINQLIDHLSKVKLSEISINAAKKNREADEKKKTQEKQKKLEEEA